MTTGYRGNGPGSPSLVVDYFSVAVVATDGDVEKVALADTSCETPTQWCEYTKDERGWSVGPHIGGSLVNDLVRGLDT